MNFIFLDIDGVLNSEKTKNKIQGFTGIDLTNCRVLKKLVDELDARIILCSSWKSDWDPELDNCTVFGKYLVKQFSKVGLKVDDKTQDSDFDRGRGIIRYLLDHPCDGFIVLDDEFFPDYKQCDILPHWVHTYWHSGLTEQHIDLAKRLITYPIIIPHNWDKKPVLPTEEFYSYNDGKYDNR